MLLLIITNQTHQSADDVDMIRDGHEFVDRFAVLHDLWQGEVFYQESKRQVKYSYYFETQEKLCIYICKVKYILVAKSYRYLDY